MHRDGSLTDAVGHALMEAGAVGETLGWAFNRAGEPVRTINPDGSPAFNCGARRKKTVSLSPPAVRNTESNLLGRYGVGGSNGLVDR